MPLLIDLFKDPRNINFLSQSVFSVQAALKLTALDLNIFSKCILTIQAICKTGDGEWCLIEESAVIILRLIQRKYLVY